MYDFVKRAKGIIHVGASLGQERELYAHYNLPVLWIEPLPMIYEQLKANISCYPQQRALQYLLIDTDGEEYKIGVANNQGQSSSILPLNLHREVWPQIDYTSQIPMLGHKLDTVIEREKVNLDDFDALVLDVQGVELLVLKGALNVLRRVNYVFTEAWDFEAYTGCCRLSELDEFFAGEGFSRVQTFRHDLDSVVGYTYDALYSRQPFEIHSALDSLGAMRPVKESEELAAPQVDMPQTSPVLWGDFTEDDFIAAKARREQESRYMFAACMSTPRWGPLSTMDIIQTALMPWSAPYFRSEGAYWHHQLTDAIERALKVYPDAIMTFDYDSLFCPVPNNSDIAKLITLMLENPDVDVIVPLQLQREGGSLIAAGDGELTISQPLMPVWFGHFGMTLFRASVFDRIKKPWFWERADSNGSWGEGRVDADAGFWLNCKENGIKVCMATDVVLGHGEYGPTFPDDQFKPIKMSLNEWRQNGHKPPVNAFNRQRFVQAALEGTNPLAKVHVAGD